MKQTEAARTDWQAGREVGEDTKKREWIPFAAASILTLAGWALLWTVGSPIWVALVYVGWVVLIAGFGLIALPLVLLPRKGKASRGGGVTQTTTVVTSGVYSVVRHPLYLGWMLAYVALVLCAQHWLVAVVAAAGIASVYLICVQEDRRLLAKFGEEYARYQRSVPRVNLLLGIVQLLRRRATP
jgi:protein-S-isoprenylcysteine O-methyltransferase Ste14